MKEKSIIPAIAVASFVIGIMWYVIRRESSGNLGLFVTLLALLAMAWIGGNIVCYLYHGDRSNLPNGIFPPSEIFSGGFLSVAGGTVFGLILESLFGL